jgi:hypothetical protein
VPFWPVVVAGINNKAGLAIVDTGELWQDSGRERIFASARKWTGTIRKSGNPRVFAVTIADKTDTAVMAIKHDGTLKQFTICRTMMDDGTHEKVTVV